MINKFLLVVFLSFFTGSLYASVDKEYGAKITWWTKHYQQVLSLFGIKKSYAIVIGIGSYNDKKFSHLPSEKDATRIKDYLVDEAGFDSVHLITGDKVTRKRIYELMSRYQKTLTNKDRFLFYWSGHGVTDSSNRKVGYLPVYASTENAATMISMLRLKNWDDGLKAKQTFYLLDACFSGIAASKSMAIRQKQTIERVSRPSRQVLTAGLDNEQTIAINDLEGGVFTRALLDGLRGKADTNKGNFQKDNVITARELEEYVRERVNHERLRVGWKEPITPVLYNFSQYAGDFFFISSDKNDLQKKFLFPIGASVSTRVIPTGHDSQTLTLDKKEEKSPSPEITASFNEEKPIVTDNSQLLDGFMGSIFSGNTSSTDKFSQINTQEKLRVNGSDNIRVAGNVEHGLIVSGMGNVTIDADLFGGIGTSGMGRVYIKGNASGNVYISGMGNLTVDGILTGDIFLSGMGTYNIKGKHIGKLIN